MNNRKHYVYRRVPEAKYEWRQHIAFPEGEEYDPNGCYWIFDTEEKAKAKVEELNSTYELCDYDDGEIEEFYEGIHFSTLEGLVSDYLGHLITFKRELTSGRGERRFELESEQDLCKVDDMLSKVFKSCKVDTFGAGFFVDPKTGKLFAYARIHYSYEHFDGGTNGCSLAYAKWDGHRWDISFSKTQREQSDAEKAARGW